MKKLLLFIVCGATLGAFASSALPAHAFPAYAQKEKKPCIYCHVNARGGGKRNAAGLWYKAHNRSLAGFVPVKAGKPATPAPKKPAAKKVKP